MFATWDVVRNMFTRGRRSLFLYAHALEPISLALAPSYSLDQISNGLPAELCQSLVGVPIFVMHVLSQMSDIILDEPTLSRADFTRTTDRIEHLLKTWTPLPVHPDDDIHTSMENFRTNEMWRHVRLIP